LKVRRNYEAVIEGQFGTRTVTGPGTAWEGPDERIRAIVPLYELSFTLAGLSIATARGTAPQFTILIRYRVHNSAPAAACCAWSGVEKGGKPPEVALLTATWQAQLKADIQRFLTELLWQQPKEFYTHNRNRLQRHLRAWLKDEEEASGLEILDVCILAIKP
jgi:hypothetical protein